MPLAWAPPGPTDTRRVTRAARSRTNTSCAVVGVPGHQVRRGRGERHVPAVRGDRRADSWRRWPGAARTDRHPPGHVRPAGPGRTRRRRRWCPRPPGSTRRVNATYRPSAEIAGSALSSLAWRAARTDRHPPGHLRPPVPDEHVGGVVGVPGHQVRRDDCERHVPAVRGDRRRSQLPPLAWAPPGPTDTRRVTPPSGPGRTRRRRRWCPRPPGSTRTRRTPRTGRPRRSPG